MKLSKVQSEWVKHLVEESTTREREALRSKEKAVSDFGVALAAWHESTEEVRRAWAEYKAATGATRKETAERLHLSNPELNFITAPPSAPDPDDSDRVG